MVPPMFIAIVVTGGRLLKGVGSVCISDIDNKVTTPAPQVNDYFVTSHDSRTTQGSPKARFEVLGSRFKVFSLEPRTLNLEPASPHIHPAIHIQHVPGNVSS